MSVRVSKLVWTPYAGQPRMIRAQWHGAPGRYTLRWGDGTSQDVSASSGPVSHLYDTPGTYSVAASYGSLSASAQITIRDWDRPPEPRVHREGRFVTVDLTDVADPVLWRLSWGDGTVTLHESGVATHGYDWGHGGTSIRVEDVPSKRSRLVTGPTIPEQPTPEPDPDPVPQFPPVDGVLWQYIGKRNTDTSRRFALRGGNLDPRTPVVFYHRTGEVNTVYTSPRGELYVEWEHPRPPHPKFDQWVSYTVHYQQNGKQYTRFLPLNAPLARANSPQVTYETADDPVAGDPFDLVVSLTKHEIGPHRIDWGDGIVEVVDIDSVPLQARHRYDRNRPEREYEVTITLPSGGTTMPRLVYPHRPQAIRYHPFFPGRARMTWAADSSNAAMPKDQFAPVVVQWADDVGQRVARLHSPTVPQECWKTAYEWSFSTAGVKKYRWYWPLADPEDSAVNVETAGTRRLGPGDPDVVEEPEQHPRHDDAAQVLRLDEFTVNSRWGSGYVGTWTVLNPSTTDVAAWHVDCHLGTGAEVHNAWCGDDVVDVANRGDGWWRLSARTPLPGGTSAYLGVRVAPCGSPIQFPEDATVTRIEG